MTCALCYLPMPLMPQRVIEASFGQAVVLVCDACLEADEDAPLALGADPQDEDD